METNLFVFGTLKRGFPLHDQGLRGAQFTGVYRTQQRFPLLIAALDGIESIGRPGNLRLTITVEPVEGGNPLQAFVYMKSRDLAEGSYHSELLESYEGWIQRMNAT